MLAEKKATVIRVWVECDLKKILARFLKKKLDNLKAEIPINPCLGVRQLSTVWKQKVDIITEIEEESGHKYDKLEKTTKLQIYQCSQKKSLSNGVVNSNFPKKLVN